MEKCVKKQYTFITNGGNVSVFVLDGEVKKQVIELEKNKEEIKQIFYNNGGQKMISDKNEDDSITEIRED